MNATATATAYAEKIAAALATPRGVSSRVYTARVWTPDVGPARVYVRLGQKDIGYLTVDASGIVNANPITRGAADVRRLAEGAIA